MARFDFEKFLACVELTRPVNGLIIFLSVILAAILAGAQQGDTALVLHAATTALLIGAGGYAINDYFDVQIDAINKPNRPLPRRAISPRTAQALWFFSTLSGLVLAAFLPRLAFLLAAFVAAALFYYSYKLKQVALLGNITIALLTGLTFIFGASVVGHIHEAWFPAIFAFLTNIIREISKDIEDLQGDSILHVGTFPVHYGVAFAHRVIVSLTAILITLTFVPYLLNMYNFYYMVLVGIIDVSLVLLVMQLSKSQAPPSVRTFNRMIKLLMVLGLIALYIGKSNQ